MTSRSIFSHNRFFHAFKKATAAISGMLFLVSTNAAFAQQAPPPASNSAAPPVIPTAAANAAAAIQQANVAPGTARMNLGSTAATMALPQAAAVQVGGHIQYFNAGQMVTPAQFMAAQQAIQAGKQALQIANTGAAIGGRFNLNAATQGVVVPAGVTGLAFNTVAPIAGDLVNAGTVYGFATNANNPTVTIAANSILNNGLITTVTPSSLQTAFNALSSANLVVLGVNGVTNTGTISSSRDLTVASTLGAINNSGSLSAAQALNLITGNGSITNGGSIVAGTDVNVGTNGGGAVTINGAGGTIQAAGAINIATINQAVSLAGGNYLSKKLNINAGTGTIDGAVGLLTGMFSSSASSEHLWADTPVLTLGNNCITGDPVVANTGDINIAGANVFGEDITYLAGKNIIGAAGASVTASGFDITMIAGGTVDPVLRTVTFDASSLGGHIDLSAATGNVLDTSTASGNAGDVTLAAYAKGVTGGTVKLNPSSFILAFAPSGQGGKVSAIAGGADLSGVGITLGNMFTSGATISGDIEISTNNPKPSTGTTLTYNANGSEVSGATVIADPLAHVDSHVNFGQLSASALGGSGGTNSATLPTNGGKGGNVTINAGSASGSFISTFGGGGGGGGSTSGVLNGVNGANGGDGGNVVINLTAALASNSIDLISTAGGGGGGGSGGGVTAGPVFGTGGLGGLGGAAGSVSITANPTSSVTTNGIWATGGGNGGAGNPATASLPGAGGGGGGSLGGGGGGGAAGINSSAVVLPAGGGGAGGGGIYGGGGGAGSAAIATTYGGGSGGGTNPGNGGAATGGGVNGQNGTGLTGGNGSNVLGGKGVGGTLNGATPGATGGGGGSPNGADGGGAAAVNNGAVTISAGSASFLSRGNSAGSFDITATTGSISVNQNMVSTGLTKLSAATDITTAAGKSITANNVQVSSTAGKIGGSAVAPLTINAPNMTANIGPGAGAGNGAWITNNFASTVNLNGTNTIGGASNLPFVLTAPSGDIQMSGASTVNAGSVDVSTNAFNMIGAGATITSSGNVKVTAAGQSYQNGASISADSVDLSGSAVSMVNGAQVTATKTVNLTFPGQIIDTGSKVTGADVHVTAAGNVIIDNGAEVKGTNTVHFNGIALLDHGAKITGGNVTLEGVTNGTRAAQTALDNGSSITGANITLLNNVTSIENGSTISGTGNVTVDSQNAVDVLTISTLNGDTSLHIATNTLTVGENVAPPPFNTVSSNGTLELGVTNLIVNQNGQILSPNANIGINSSGTITNNGSITAANLALVNSVGELTVAGNGTFTTTKSLSLASTGNLNLGSAVDLQMFDHGQSNLLFVASGNINYNGGGEVLSTGVGANDSGNVTMLAGANWTWSAAQPTSISSTSPSLIGGGVHLDNAGTLTIDTSNGGIGKNAGDVAIYTNKGGLNNGSVSMGDILTSATIVDNSNHNGSVRIIADTTQLDGVAIGDIIAGSGGGAFITNNNASINIRTSRNTFSAPVFTNGVLASGSLTVGPDNANGGVFAGDIFAPGSSVSITAGGGISTFDITTAGAGGNLGAGGNGGQVSLDTTSGVNSIAVGWIRAYGGGGAGAPGGIFGDNGFAGGKGGNVTLASKGNIQVFGDINTSGGGGGGGGNSFGNVGGAGGDAGLVAINDPLGNVTISGPVLSSGGAGGSSGVVGDLTRGGGGGGSFGGGGGGAYGGAGGGGFLGGGGSDTLGNGTGGGVYGAGVSLGAFPSTDGQNGAGGNGLHGYQGGLFGISGEGGTAQGSSVTQVGQSGSGLNGGIGGTSGGLVANVGTLSIPNTIKSAGDGGLFQPPLPGYDYAAIGNSGFGNEIISAYGGGVATVALTTSGALTLAGSIGATAISGFLTAGVLNIIGLATLLKFATVNIDTTKLTNEGSLVALLGDATITGLTNQGPLGPPAAMNLNNSGLIASLNGDVTISSKAGNNLVFGGGGSIQAPNGDITLTATDNGTNDAGNYLIAAGNQTFVPGPTATNQVTLNAGGPTQTIWIQPGVQVVSTGKLVLNTSNLILDATPVGNPLVITTSGPGMNVTNTVGDLNLSLNFDLQGKNLFLGSVGNIIGNGLTSIDLSSTTGNGGNLSMVAGFNLSNSKGVVTVGTPNAGGSIILPNVVIDTSSTAAVGNGGSVTAVARNGNIELDTIFAQSTNDNGGNVVLFGNGVKISGIQASGDATNNSIVLIKSGTSSTVGGTISYTAGGRNTGIGAGVFLNSGDSGNIQVLGNVNGGSVTMQTGGSGSINTGSGVQLIATDLTGTGLHLISGTGGINSFVNPLIFDSAVVGVNTTGNAFLTTNRAAFSIDGATANQLQIVDTSATADVHVDGDVNSNNFLLSTPNGGAITVNANVAGVNGINGANATSLHFVTNTFNNNAGKTVKGALVQIDSATATNLVINNAGTLQTDNGTVLINALGTPNASVSITGGGLMTATGTGTVEVNANGATGNVTFTGSQNFGGTTNINATGANGFIQFNAPAVVNGTGALNLNTRTLNLLGGVNAVTGTPLRFNSPNNLGTIANANGDVNIPGGLIFHGQSLAILASGNVNAAPGVIIDLSNSNPTINGGNGGTLTVFAGYNFSIRPDANIGTGGQVGPDGTVYYLGTPSNSGGSINLGATEISTKSTLANGGNIIMLAHNGVVNNGTITVGNLNTNASGTAGFVTLIGRGGITTGDITTNGALPGDVNIVAGTPNITSNANGVQIWNGVVNPGFVPGLVPANYTGTPDNNSGNILVGNISARPTFGAAVAQVVLVTQGTGSVNVKPGSKVDADRVIAVSGSGGIGSVANPFAMNATNVTLSADNLSDASGHARGDVFATNTSSTVLQHAVQPFSVAYLPPLPAPPNNLFLSTGKIFDLKQVGTNNSITLVFNKDLVATDFRLHSTGTGGISQFSAAEFVDTQTANLTTEGAPIGALGQPIQLKNTTSLHFEGTPSGSTIIRVSGASNTNLTGANTSADARLTSLNGGFNFAAGSTLVSTLGVTINANGSVTQTDTGLATTIKAPVITINTTGGTIGTSSQALNVGSQTFNLDLTTTSKSGAADTDTFLNNISGALTIKSSTAHNYTLNSDSPVGPSTAITIASAPFSGLLASGDVSIATGTTGSVDIPSPVSGVITSGGSVTINTGDFSIDNDLASGIIALNDITINAAHDINSDGILAAGRNMSLTAGNLITLDTNSTTSALGTMAITAKNLVTKGVEGSIGNATVNVTNLWDNSGTFRAGQVLILTGPANLTANVGALTNSGTISSTNNMNVTATANTTVGGDIVNLLGGVINAGGTMTMTAHSIGNSGNMTGNGDVTLTTSLSDNTSFIKNFATGVLNSTTGKLKATTYSYTNSGNTTAGGEYVIVASDNANQNGTLTAGTGLLISGDTVSGVVKETKNVNFNNATTNVTLGDSIIVATNVLSKNSTFNTNNGALYVTGETQLTPGGPVFGRANDVSFLNDLGANTLTASQGIYIKSDTATLEGTTTAGTGVGSTASLSIDGLHNISVSGTTTADKDIQIFGTLGTTTTAGTLKALNGDFIGNVGAFTNTGAITAQNDISIITQNGDLTNNGGSMMAVLGDITYTVNGDFKQIGAAATTNAATGFIVVDAHNINNAGSMLAGTNITLKATNDVTNTATGVVSNNGDLTSISDTFNNAGTFGAFGKVSISKGTNVTGDTIPTTSFANSGTISAGNLATQSDLLIATLAATNSGSLTATRDVRIEGGRSIGGDVFASNTIDSTGGSITAGHDIVLTGVDITVNNANAGNIFGATGAFIGGNVGSSNSFKSLAGGLITATNFAAVAAQTIDIQGTVQTTGAAGIGVVLDADDTGSITIGSGTNSAATVDSATAVAMFANTITNFGTINSDVASDLNAETSFTNKGTGVVSGLDVALETPAVLNDGSFNATGNLFFYGLTNGITSTALGNGSIKVGEGGSLTVQTTGDNDIAVLNDQINRAGAGVHGANVLLLAGGSILNSVGDTNIDTSSTLGDAGSISFVAGTGNNVTRTGLTTATLNTSGSFGVGNINLGNQANGFKSTFNASTTAAASDGGNVNLIALNGWVSMKPENPGEADPTDPNQNNITTKGTVGGTSGSVLVAAGGINPAPIIYVGAYPITGGAMTVGNISTNGVGAGAGSINLFAANPNFQGSSVTFANGTTLADLTTVPAPTSLTTGSIMVGVINTSNGLGGADNANASVNIQTNGNVNFGSTDTSQVSSTHNWNIHANQGTLTLATQALTAAADINGDGGSINVEAGNVTYLNQIPGVNTALQFLAKGTNNPGDIRFVRNSTSLLVLGTNGYDLLVDNRGGTGKNGGNIEVINGGQMFVVVTPVAPTTPAGSDVGLLYAPGTNITLQSGAMAAGLLTINGGLDTTASAGSGAVGGNVTLISNSPTIFNYGNTTNTNTNGIQGSIKVAGDGAALDGSVHLENRGGGLTYNPTTANAFGATNVNNVELVGSLQSGSGNVVLSVTQTIGAGGNVSLSATGTPTGTGNATISVTKAITAGGDFNLALTADKGTAAFTTPAGANISAKTATIDVSSLKGSTFTLASNLTTTGAGDSDIRITQNATGGTSVIKITGALTATTSSADADVIILNTASTTGSIATKAISAGDTVVLHNTSAGTGSVANTGTLTASNGSVILRNDLTNTTGAPTGTITVGGVISAKENVRLLNNGNGFGGKTNISVGQNVTATNGDIELVANGATGGGAIVTTGAATLTTTAAAGILTANSGGTIGSGTGLSINSANVSFDAKGAIIVNDKLTTGVNLGESTSTTSTFTMTTPATLNVVGQISAPLAVSLKSTGAGKDINLLGPAGNTSDIATNAATVGTTKGGIVTLTTTGSGDINNGSGNNIVGLTVNFVTGSGGNVGTVATPVNIDASNVSFNTPGNGTVNIEGQRNSALTVVSAVRASGNVIIDALDALVMKGSLAGSSNVQLFTNNLGAGITLTGSIGTANTAGTIQLQTNGGNITGAGKLTATDVALATFGGNIGGTTTATALNVNTGSLSTVQTGTPSILGPILTSGSVNIKNAYNGTNALVLDTDANAYGNFTLTTGSGITMQNLTVANGSINIVAAKGVTTVLHDANIAATNGSITLQNTAGKIVLGDLVSTSAAAIVDNNISIATDGATGGAINIVIGAVPAKPVAGYAPTNAFISVTGTGSMFFGQAGKAATATTPAQPSINVVGFTDPQHPVVANFQAKNTMLQFNAGKTASNITVNQGVRIFADPPTPVTAPSDTVMSVPSINVDAAKSTPVVNPIHSVSFSTSSNAAAAAVATAPSLSFNFAPQNFSAATLAQLAAQAMSAPRGDQFATETELLNGEIPAVLSSDEGIKVQTRVASHAVLTGGITKHAAGAKSVALTQGSVVFAPTVDTVVHTNYGDVTIGANSVVLILSFNGGVGVYNLHDTKRGAVAIKNGERTLHAAPGQSVVLTTATNASFDQINPAQLFLYRNINEQSLAPAMKAFTGEFAPLSAIHAVLPLKQLVNSKDPAARRLADNMLKTAAIVHQVHAAKGAYQQILHPSVAAWMH